MTASLCERDEWVSSPASATNDDESVWERRVSEWVHQHQQLMTTSLCERDEWVSSPASATDDDESVWERRVSEWVSSPASATDDDESVCERDEWVSEWVSSPASATDDDESMWERRGSEWVSSPASATDDDESMWERRGSEWVSSPAVWLADMGEQCNCPTWETCTFTSTFTRRPTDRPVTTVVLTTYHSRHTIMLISLSNQSTNQSIKYDSAINKLNFSCPAGELWDTGWDDSQSVYNVYMCTYGSPKTWKLWQAAVSTNMD